MKSLSPIDVTVLTWLKPELDGTLQQARAALERFAEEGEGPGALRECFGHLHQAAGTLGMVELTGAARLAEEMEQLAAGLADASVPGGDNAYTLLMQCIVQLPDYLERLQNGNRDVPVVLLPLINELRSIRGEPALGEESVYSAPTQHPLPGAAVARIQAAAAGEDIAGLSLQFQAHLQRWLAADDPQAAGNLGEVCLRIAAQSRDDADRKLFWVASALLDALAGGAIAADAALKRSLTKVDQEVNHLNNRGIGEIRQLSPVRITQELLYFVSRNGSATDRLAEVEAAFELASLVPDEDEIRHAKSSLLGRNNALLDSVAAVIKEDILKVKDSLDMAIRQSDKNPADMAAVLDVLTRVENTLALIDAEGARRHIHENRETIRAYVEGRSALSDAELMEIAKSLLSVESMLDQHGGESAASRQAQMAGEFLSSAQSHQLLDALIRESIVNFLQVRQAFVAFVESYWDHQQLEPIPGLLKQVSGALAILEYTPVSNYIDAVSAYTRIELIQRQGIPGAEQMERLAEVLASIEYYLESVRDRRPNRERILDITEKGLEALKYWPLPEQAAHAPSAPTPVAAPVMAESVPAPVPETPQPTPVMAPVITVPPSDAHGDAVPGFDMEAEGIDDEIREIFLEEFAEERTNLDGFYADWRGDPDNIELVRPIRRVFHTLKGSGRLVGAKALSEFSWKIESLLNRVLDGSRPPSAAVLAMVGTAVDTLPRFQKALLGEHATVDMQGLCDVAERLAAGEDVVYQPKPASVIPAGEPEVAAMPAEEIPVEMPQPPASAEPIIDPVLLEILRPEIGGHLETLNAWLTRSAASGHAEFEDAVFRAIHTMNGAFAMSEVGTLAGVLAPAEALVRRGIAHHAGADPEMLAGLAQVADAVQATLDDLSANTPPSTYPDLEAWIAILRDRLPDIPLSVPTPAAMADIEAQRLEAEQLEAERIEAERIEAARLEAEHLETQRLLAERLSAEAAAAEAAAAEAAAAEAAAAEAAAAEAAAAEAAAAEAAAAEAAAAIEVMEADGLDGLSMEELERLTDPNYRADEPAAESIETPAEPEPPVLEPEAPPAVAAEAPEETIAPADEAAAPALDMHGLDEELLDIFTEEAKDLLDQSDNLLVALKQAGSGMEPLFGLQRNLHTLKGGARMAGLFGIGELSHSLESFIQHSADTGTVPDAGRIAVIEQSLDALHRMSHSVEERRAPEAPERHMRLLETGLAGAQAAAGTSSAADGAEAAGGLKPLSGPIEVQDLDADEGLRTPQEVVRIRADLLDQLVNFAGEVAIYRARLEQQLTQFKTNLVELDQTTSRLREQLRRLDIETEAQIAARNIREADQGNKDFDPLELDRFTTQQQLSRSLAESSNDLINLQATLDDLTRHHESLLLQQSRVSSELQEGLMRTRMLPFETLLPRLRRVLRQAAQDAGKQVELRVDGAHGEMDRTVLDRMIAPLEHLLRNAVAHGIETPEQRRAAGKPETGTVSISIAPEGTEVVLSVRDDGRGLDSAQIRRKAIERGLISGDAELGEQQILALIIQTGFSTADSVTRLAGRGIGMDVVSKEIGNLNGSLGIQSTGGRGTEFVIRLPLNLAVTKAVFVKIGDSQFAIPIASVDGVGRIGREELEEKLRLEVPEFNYAGNRHKIYDLGGLLDLPAAKAVGSMQMPMLLSKSGQDRIAICVDQVLGSQEIVVKPVGPQVTSVPGVYGASIMPDGGVVIILDLAPLVRHNAARQVPKVAQAVESTGRSMPLVMVVDDSITMRKVTSRILERNNYEVLTARDGVEAIEKMAEQVPDLVLLDIEMPRMDGYEVAQNMKADARLQHVPIMMITSRTGEKHRQRAFDLGVERYLGKPYQEFELMRQVNEVFKK